MTALPCIVLFLIHTEAPGEDIIPLTWKDEISSFRSVSVCFVSPIPDMCGPKLNDSYTLMESEYSEQREEHPHPESNPLSSIGITGAWTEQALICTIPAGSQITPCGYRQLLITTVKRKKSKPMFSHDSDHPEMVMIDPIADIDRRLYLC